jgi:hypothetical protein
MNKLVSIKVILFLFGAFISMTIYAQNMETITPERMENCGIVIPEQCTPDDMIIIINSSIQNLRFESNMLPDSAYQVIYYGQANQYVICHPRMKFILTVSGANLQSVDIEVFNLEISQICYRISANTTRGTVNIYTNPPNATVIFRELRDLVLSTNNPITNISGSYRVNILKAQYLSVDTVIVIPSNAEKSYNINLIPQFARIKLNLSTDDKAPFMKPPVIWIDSVKIELDALVTPGKNQRRWFDGVEFLQFYEDNMIPLNEGPHSVRIEAESYFPYKSSIDVQNGKITNLYVNLEPIYGYLTFVDKQMSEGATIFIDNQNIGKVPLLKAKTRIGNHKIRFEKPGLVSEEEEYSVLVSENQNTDLEVSMEVAKKITFNSEPSNAEVLMDGKRIGFTPFSIIVTAGNHQLIVRKTGYAGEKLSKVVSEQTPDEEIVTVKLRSIFPLPILSEEDDLLVSMEGTEGLENIEIDSTAKTPATIQLPYGKYKITLKKGDNLVYKGSIEHSPDILKRGKLPAYSRFSFNFLSGSFENKNNYEVSFGRAALFSGLGLSTALVNFDSRLTTVRIDSVGYSIDYTFKTLAPNIFFMNWDWRLGGSILRQVDVNLLGRAKYTPGLKFISLHLPKYTDVAMQNYFYGLEISTRLSWFNISFRYGRQINIGKIHYWDMTNDDFSKNSFLVNESRNVGSIGITFNAKVNRSNNMLRLWNRPLFDLELRKSGNKKSSQ